MKNILAAVALFLSAMMFCKAQDTVRMTNVKPIEYNNKLGFAGSMFSGYGISYEYNASKMITIEFTGSVYGSGGTKDNYSSSSSDSYLTAVVGAEIQRNFFVSYDSRFYGLVGVGLWIDNTNYTYYGTYRHNLDYTGGLALGWEFTFGKRIIFNVEGGYLYRDINTKGTYDINYSGSKELTTTHSYYLGFGGGIGLYYAF